MASVFEALENLVESVVGFVVLIILGILSFYVTVFVVKTGSALAGVSPSGDFVALSAALIVVASMIAGSMN
ncbi:MAG: hypothetical protein ABEJ75_04570 [Candidatus Nanohaloarchaea archaeon]